MRELSLRRAVPIEQMLWFYAKGRRKDVIEFDGGSASRPGTERMTDEEQSSALALLAEV